MYTFTGIKEVFKIFQNKESYFDEINKKQSNRLIFNQLLLICGFAFLYGMVMGSYHSFLQSIVTGLKVIILFLSTVIICFPSFFIIQQVLGSKMSFRQMGVIVLSGVVLTATIALSFAPIVVVFQVTGGNYHFLQLLHVAIFIFAGIFGMRLMVEALKFACENKNIYPQIGVTVFRIWIIILAFVGIQLAWNLRPFLCEKNEEFKLFRKYEGNFYTAIVYSVEQLVSPQKSEKQESKQVPGSSVDTIRNKAAEAEKILNQIKK
ncbi:MAG: hypothetical protein M0Q38_03135 [Bacteroidales bacterium]|jgi:hypothetical protein|nr:hypothetical protein [Bacteroidales bacterium]